MKKMTPLKFTHLEPTTSEPIAASETIDQLINFAKSLQIEKPEFVAMERICFIALANKGFDVCVDGVVKSVKVWSTLRRIFKKHILKLSECNPDLFAGDRDLSGIPSPSSSSFCHMTKRRSKPCPRHGDLSHRKQRDRKRSNA